MDPVSDIEFNKMDDDDDRREQSAIVRLVSLAIVLACTSISLLTIPITWDDTTIGVILPNNDWVNYVTFTMWACSLILFVGTVSNSDEEVRYIMPMTVTFIVLVYIFDMMLEYNVKLKHIEQLLLIGYSDIIV